MRGMMRSEVVFGPKNLLMASKHPKRHMHTAGVRSDLINFSNAGSMVSVIVVLSKISKIRDRPIRTCTFTFTTLEVKRSCSIRGKIWSLTCLYSNFLCKNGTFSRTSFNITGSCSSRHRSRNGRSTACWSAGEARDTCKSSSLRKRVTTSIGISFALYNGFRAGHILAWKCAQSVTLSLFNRPMMMGTTTPYKFGKSNAPLSRGKTRSRRTRCVHNGDCVSDNNLGKPFRKVTRWVSSFSLSVSRKRTARTLTSMKNSELMKAAMVRRSAGFALSTLSSTG
mmetsp:Transcript_2797/g.8416  ORF Transcript_2797/g.8416 Transcript_2797/m.8416 type:complete len:281 (+) Transcript_2797:371-1213(+)